MHQETTKFMHVFCMHQFPIAVPLTSSVPNSHRLRRHYTLVLLHQLLLTAMAEYGGRSPQDEEGNIREEELGRVA
jgi:hypothetical protein